MQHNAFPGSYASSASVIFLVLKNNGARNIPWIYFKRNNRRIRILVGNLTLKFSHLN